MQAVRIISAVSIGVQKTIDLEVDHPDHQFLASGVLVSNSHANCYAYLGYVCQFLKENYPIEWWTAVLSNSSIKDLQKNAEACSGYVDPPNVNVSDVDFFVAHSGRIVYPLRMVKGVANAAEAIVTARAGGAFVSVDDFFARVDRRRVNSRVVRALIWSGAFDSLGAGGSPSETRNGLWAQYRSARGESSHEWVSEVGTLSAQRELMPFGSPSVADFIPDLAGVPCVSTARAVWDGYRENQRSDRRMTPSSRFVGVVASARRHTTKNGKPMLFVDLDGGDATLSALLFEDLITTLPEETVASLLAGGAVALVGGKLSSRADRLSLVANSISVYSGPTQLDSGDEGDE